MSIRVLCREQIESLEETIETHKTYLERLDEALDLLDDDIITVDDVEEIKESVNYYVDSHDEPDFVEDEYWFDNIMEKKEQAGEEEQEENEEEEIDPEELKQQMLQKLKKQKQQQQQQLSKKTKGKPTGASAPLPKPSDVFSTLINAPVRPPAKVSLRSFCSCCSSKYAAFSILHPTD